MLCPQVALQAQEMFCIIETIGRIVVIDAGQRQVAANQFALYQRIVLIPVQIAPVTGTHYDVVTGSGGFYALNSSLP